MRYLIGTDEAGYGPNLGPLAVSATCWSLPEEMPPESIREALADVVSERPAKNHVAIGDSKKLHVGGSLRHLERGVLAALVALGRLPEEAFDEERIMGILCGVRSTPERRAFPCFAAPEFLPQEEKLETCLILGNRLREVFFQTGIELCDLHTELVFPQRFNEGVRRLDSKGAFLSDTTLQLAWQIWREILDSHDEPLEVFLQCDKHGGRDRYLTTLWDNFPGLTFCAGVESREKSEYVHYGERATLHVTFQAKGETQLAVALASMASKYLRELAMGRFNRWWQQAIPTLQPTAGYPQDAKRFRKEITAEVEQRAISWDAIWRER